jgi:hypothetical protein
VLNHILSHLPPKSLSDAALVSHHFHRMVTTPHAWRMAFARYFHGAQALTKYGLNPCVLGELSASLIVEKRIFTRLMAHASWRNEYILRTGLLQSLARGRPAETHGDGEERPPKPHPMRTGSGQVTYNSNLVTTVNHLHAVFGNTNKKSFDVIHGADEGGSACLSDPKKGKLAQWGCADRRLFSDFFERYPDGSRYGLGPGQIIGVANVMSVSQPHGMVYAEGFPGGSVYYRSTDERRGRTLALVLDVSDPELGIPQLHGLETICSVWISKTSNISEISRGLVGILTGSSHGIISSYSLGTKDLYERRLEQGEVTARWVLSPGVPIIAIAVDDSFSVQRQSSRRLWAVALNALGEVYYLDELPLQPSPERKKLDADSLERLAWRVGRSVYWKLVGATKRVAKPDPFRESSIDDSYSPRTSWNGMGLSAQQISTETRKIETLMQCKPKYFRRAFKGWEMRRRLEVDFGGSNTDESGEGIFVVNCGLDRSQSAAIKRFTRCKMVDPGNEPLHTTESLASGLEIEKDPLVDSPLRLDDQPTWSFKDLQSSRRSSAASHEIPGINATDEWRTAVFKIEVPKSAEITTLAIDMSTFSLLTVQEDPLLNMDASSGASTPNFSPQRQTCLSNSPSDIPGQRGRFLAAGTNHGTVIVWNMRAPIPPSNTLNSVIHPVRIIQTDSPEISCLALSALYLVHGGNDGLVQAWDPLASVSEPIRTLNSRFSSLARRRLIAAQAMPDGLGFSNRYAAGAIYLDPDPTILRGMVSLGAHLRYWSYSTLATDQYNGNKRRLRRSRRAGNHGTGRTSGAARGSLHDYIVNEKLGLEQDKKEMCTEEERLAGRFGIGLLGPGASEAEVLAYATFLSEESAVGGGEKKNSSDGPREVLNEEDADALQQSDVYKEDADLAEAIRLSLQEGHLSSSLDVDESMSTGAAAFTIRYVKARKSSPTSPRRGSKKTSGAGGESEVSW